MPLPHTPNLYNEVLNPNVTESEDRAFKEVFKVRLISLSKRKGDQGTLSPLVGEERSYEDAVRRCYYQLRKASPEINPAGTLILHLQSPGL